MDFVSAVSLVTGKIHAIHNVQYIVSKEFVTKPMVAVHRDVHRDIMETCVIEHAVSGVQEGYATNTLQHVLMDVCRTGQGLNVTVRFTMINKANESDKHVFFCNSQRL